MNPKIPCLAVWMLFQFHVSGISQFDFKNFPIDFFALPDIMWSLSATINAAITTYLY